LLTGGRAGNSVSHSSQNPAQTDSILHSILSTTRRVRYVVRRAAKLATRNSSRRLAACTCIHAVSSSVVNHELHWIAVDLPLALTSMQFRVR